MKFNQLSKKKGQIQNHEGARAYKMNNKLELYTTVVTSTLSNKFYEGTEERLKRIRDLIAKVSPRFVAQLAIYTREEMHLRSIPLVLVVELAKVHSGDSLIKNTIARVVKRADEITELLAYYQLANKRTDTKKLHKLSKQIQKGLSIAFNKFDEYQFAKYNRDTEIKIKDALFLVHPKPKDEAQQALFNKIVQDTLETPYTWEVELSTLGQLSYDSPELKAKAVREKWEELIDSKRLGYMAMMRNLRNMLQAEISLEHIQKVVDHLSNPYQVQRSRQLPFRFLSAYRQLEQLKLANTKPLLDALEVATTISAANIKGFDEATKVVLACDVSGSMYTPVSAKSSVRCFDIGLILSMLLRNKSDNVITGIFGNTWMTVDLPKENILHNTMALNKMEGKVGYATNGYKVLQDLNERKVAVDKVMMFTDCQLWNSTGDGSSLQKEWSLYKKNISPNAKMYLFDLNGYGNSPTKLIKNDVFIIGGWSNKVFDVLEAIENGKEAISKIKEIDVSK